MNAAVSQCAHSTTDCVLIASSLCFPTRTDFSKGSKVSGGGGTWEAERGMILEARGGNRVFSVQRHPASSLGSTVRL